MHIITTVREEVNAANNIKLATFRALRLKCSAMSTVKPQAPTDVLYDHTASSAPTERSTAFINHGTTETWVEISSSTY
jgi:hypothetical protein